MLTHISLKHILIFTIFTLLASVSYSEQLNAINFANTVIIDQSARSLAQKIANEQPELLRKAVLHYLLQEIARMQDSQDQMAIKNFLNSWFRQENLQSVHQIIEKRMREKLFEKLQMQKLSDIFKREIEQNPEEYYLTFDMYDLLID